MARKRRSSSNRSEAPAEQPETPATTATMPTQQPERQVTRMAGLTAEQIAGLLSKTRTKGQYVLWLNEFIASGEMGVEVNEQWVEARDKKAATLKQGFDSAKDNKEASEGSEHIKVVSNDEKVYLINLAHADIAASAEPEAEAA